MLATSLTVSLAVDARPAAAQDDGLRLTADATYRVLVDERALEVEVRYVATNVVPDQRQGFQIIQTFFRSIFEAIPKGATDIRATRSNGDSLTVTLAELTAAQQEEFADSPFDTWEIDLGPNLFYQQTREFTLTFRLPDGGNRNDDAWARVNGAFASFPVVARGDGGRSSVRVEFPPGFEVETFGEDVDRQEAFGATVLVQSDIADPGDWFVVVVASSDFGLNRRDVEVDGVPGGVTIAWWPGDDEWEAFVEEGIQEGIPALVDAIGVPWPVEDGLEIREAIAPSLAGYGGWYYEPPETDEDDATIEVGEYLITDLLIHEIAHAWFNGDFASARWINEGFAEYFGIRIAEELAPGEVETFEAVTPNSAGNVDLNAWRVPGAFVDAEVAEQSERWGYAASFQVMNAIAEEIGEEKFRESVVALFDRVNPYEPSLDAPGRTSVDWRDVLDAFEEVGGSGEVGDLLTTWVLNDRQIEQLEPRVQAREALVALDGVEPGWAHPDIVWELMADWEFDDALDLFSRLTDVQNDASALEDLAADAGLDVPDDPQRAYETLADVDAYVDGIGIVSDAIATQTEALDAVVAARDRAAEPTGTLATVGLWGEDVPAIAEQAVVAYEDGDYDGAVAFAADVDEILDDAESVGTTRALIAGAVLLGVLVLLALLFVLRRRRRRRRREADEADETETSDETATAGEDESSGAGAVVEGESTLFGSFPTTADDDERDGI
ncbi:MAG: M1 family aminopeptidase [Actinomycetota bacterium]